jgi:hypothetical protein
MGVADAWAAFRTGDVPPRLVAPTQIAIRRLLDAVTAHDRMATYATSIDAAYAGNDLQLRYRPVAEIDARRFELWARRAQVDAMGRSVGGVRSDEVTLQWIRDRIAHTLDPVELVRLDTKLGRLGTAVEDHDLGAAVRTARALERLVDASIRSAGQPGRPEARPASRRAPAGS